MKGDRLMSYFQLELECKKCEGKDISIKEACDETIDRPIFICNNCSSEGGLESFLYIIVQTE